MMNRYDMVRRLRRLLDAEWMAEAEIDLERLEDAGELPRWLEELVRAADDLPLPDVPDVVRQDLRQMFEDPPLVEVCVARLLRDSRLHERHAGVRGAGTATGWTMVYTSRAADVVIDVWPRDDDDVELEGHVMAHSSDELAYRVRLEGPVEAHVDGDRLGRFTVPSLPRGRYKVTVGNGRIELTLDADLTEEPGQ